MFLFPPRLDRHVIDAGRVYCPRRETDIDVDRCASCECLVSLDERSSPPAVHCRPDRPLPVFLLRVL
jgi:hypothetical protein